MRKMMTEGQMVLMRGTSTMAAPRKYSLELRERAVRMYRTSDPKPQIKKLAVDLGVHPEALRGWIRQAEADAGQAGTDVADGGEHRGPFAATVRERLVEGLAPQGGVVVDVLPIGAIPAGAALVEQVHPAAEGGLRHDLPGRDSLEGLLHRFPGRRVGGQGDVAPRGLEAVHGPVVEQLGTRVPGRPVGGGELLGHGVAQDDLGKGDHLTEGSGHVPQVQLHRSRRRGRSRQERSQAGPGDQRLQEPRLRRSRLYLHPPDVSCVQIPRFSLWLMSCDRGQTFEGPPSTAGGPSAVPRGPSACACGAGIRVGCGLHRNSPGGRVGCRGRCAPVRTPSQDQACKAPGLSHTLHVGAVCGRAYFTGRLWWALLTWLPRKRAVYSISCSVVVE
ncbi:transposase [Streptomyces anulatus]|uniref:transposase n=1 Tax=Streptomyces anulatus TaxID=1892 RepID=UPI003407C6C1